MTADSLTPEDLLYAYTIGVFPMADSQDDPEIQWVNPQRRGIIPLEGFHISRSLRRAILRMNYEISVNRDFGAVLSGCADRTETWINARIAGLFHVLHAQGHAHSLEIWRSGRLIGGVYGLAIGAAFMGESMFSRETDASKIVLAWLVHRLRTGGFTLFDTQFLTPHLRSLGGMEISRGQYHWMLGSALQKSARFIPPGYQPLPSSIVSSSGNTSSSEAG